MNISNKRGKNEFYSGYAECEKSRLKSKKTLDKIPENIRPWEIMAVRKTVLPMAMAVLTFVATMTGCVKDELYDTPHPDKGAVVITTDWTDALAEATVPDEYCLSMDEGKPERTKERTCCYPSLLVPGRHTLLVYNEPQGMVLSGSTATVNAREDGTLEPLPEYLFLAVKELDVVRDDTLRITLPMERRICPIVLHLSLSGENTEEIASIEATLGGIAGSVDLQTGAIGKENLAVNLDVRQVETKTRAYTEGKLEMKCRVVGVNTQERQLLTVRVTMADGYVQTITSDLTEYLKDLNTEMEPIELTGKVEAPQDGHFGGTIDDWEAVNGGDIDAH